MEGEIPSPQVVFFFRIIFPVFPTEKCRNFGGEKASYEVVPFFPSLLLKKQMVYLEVFMLFLGWGWGLGSLRTEGSLDFIGNLRASYSSCRGGGEASKDRVSL